LLRDVSDDADHAGHLPAALEGFVDQSEGVRIEGSKPAVPALPVHGWVGRRGDVLELMGAKLGAPGGTVKVYLDGLFKLEYRK
jgi:hypothetical protein